MNCDRNFRVNLKKPYRHDLSHEPSLLFFKESLEETNLLSIEALRTVNTQKGSFFTLLPKEANLVNLYQFSEAILPETTNQTGPVGNLHGVYTYSEILSLKKEVGEYLIDLVKKHRFFCIVDDFNSRYNEAQRADLFKKFGKHHENEIYYMLTPENFSQIILLKCLDKSTTFWHSLCILTKARLDSSDVLNKEDSQEICDKAAYVIVGAYDGEGYIFWERANQHRVRKYAK